MESQYIALFVVSRLIKKFFFNWLCQYLSFLNIFFNRFCPVEKGGVTPNCLYHDSLTLRNNTLHDLIALTQNVKSLEEHISNCRPWHVIECCCVVVDLYRMKPRGDLFIDGWNWSYSKTYIVSLPNKVSQFRILKEYTKAKKYLNWRPHYCFYGPSIKATDRAGNTLDAAEKYEIVNYKLKSSANLNFPPSSKPKCIPVLEMIPNNI